MKRLITQKQILTLHITLLCVILLPVWAYAKPKPRSRVAAVWYVNTLQTGTSDGTTWATAFDDLQLALNVASSGDDIWVAQGTYLPSDTGTSNDTLDASFSLIDGVAVYGGFEGTETDVAQRDPTTNITVLSGDLQQDDSTGGNLSNNAKHVLTGSNISTLTLLDGFTIRAGNADDVTGGGGLLLQNSTGLHISQCGFIENNTQSKGGAINIGTYSSVILDRCRLRKNQGEIGGCISNSGGLTISNSLITANLATTNGGAIVSTDTATSLQIVNCTITQNAAYVVGGGIVVDSGILQISNSIVWGNSHLSGDNDVSQIWHTNSISPIQITYSCVQNLHDDLVGSNNIILNPRFSDLLGPDGERISGDEDFSLLATSPCIDSGNNVDAVGSLDLDGLARFIDDPFTVNTGIGTSEVVDMGAYEYSPTGLADIGGIVIWNSINDGSFHDPTNWYPQRVPTIEDTALFSTDRVIDITSNISVNALVVVNGEVEFQIQNIDVTINSSENPIRILAYGVDDVTFKFDGEFGRVIIPNGAIQIGGDEEDRNFDDSFVLENGAELVVGLMRILDGGRFNGGIGDSSISAEVRNTGGTIDPSGFEPGLLEINGDYSSVPQDTSDANAKGSMLFTFDNTSSSGHTHDILNVSGTATLGGVLGLQFMNNYPVTDGDILTFINSSTMSGTFDTVWSTGLPSNLFCEWMTSAFRGTGGGNIGGGNPISFGTPVSTALSADPNGFIVADLDGVNGVDLAVVFPNANPVLAGSVVVFLNNGMAAGVWQGFSTSTPVIVGVNPLDIEFGDLDGDGDIDLVVANHDDNTISTLFNAGSASFTVSTYVTDGGPATIAIANYVEDGALLDDIVVGCDTAPSMVSVLQNQSTPGLRGSSFNWMNSISVPVPIDIDPGDVNNDKGFDYIILNSPGDTAWVYEGDSSGGSLAGPFGYGDSYGLPANSSPIAQMYSDLNNDGFDDLVTVNNAGGSLSILRGTGTSFDIPSSVPVGTLPEAMAISDLDNDGDGDIIVSVIGATSLQRELLIARNDTTPPTTITLTDIGTPLVSGYVPTHVSTGDFNGDGFQDIVSVTELIPLTGHAVPAVTVLLNTSTSTCAADFDGSGSVAVNDLLQLIGAWGAIGGVEDLDGGGTVAVSDLLILIGAWGPC